MFVAPSVAPAQVRAALAGGTASPFAGGDSGFAVEDVDFDPDLVPALLVTPVGGTLQVSQWPVVPGARADVELTRFDVYAPDARIVAIDAAGERDVPRSSWRFFAGRSSSDPSLRLVVSVDPDSGELSGFSESAAGRAEWRPLPEASGTRLRVADPRSFLTAAEKASGQDVACGQEGLPPSLDSLFGSAGNGAEPPLFSEAITTLHRATIGVDTDNEFFTNKFGGDVANYTTRANNYIASLIAGMTVIYERDLLVRLTLGTTFLRLPAGGDPYGQGGSPANPAQLTEFSNYWAGGCGGGGCGTARALAMLLSGKSTGGGSGIAWLNSLCSNTNGYSVSQLFMPGSASAASQEVYVVGHEVGHNFGSPHTHCYNPPIDHCYASQGGCYTGPTSCPATATINGVTGVKGTIMSYCHGLGGCSGSSVFHPASVVLLQPLVQGKVNQCIFPAGAALQVASVTPKSGGTAGGTPVTIKGAAFVAGGSLAVSLGGVAATNVQRVNDSTITAVTGPHATGAVSLSLTNGNGGTAALAPAYFYAPPVVTDNFYTLVPCRLLDTRTANGPVGGPVLAAGAARTFTVSGRCGVLASASAISANVTVVSPAQAGALSIYPGNAMFLGTTAINFKTGNVRSNNAVIELATDGAGTITILNQSVGSVHVVLDVNGQFR